MLNESEVREVKGLMHIIYLTTFLALFFTVAVTSRVRSQNKYAQGTKAIAQSAPLFARNTSLSTRYR